MSVWVTYSLGGCRAIASMPILSNPHGVCVVLRTPYCGGLGSCRTPRVLTCGFHPMVDDLVSADRDLPSVFSDHPLMRCDIRLRTTKPFRVGVSKPKAANRLRNAMCFMFRLAYSPNKTLPRVSHPSGVISPVSCRYPTLAPRSIRPW